MAQLDTKEMIIGYRKGSQLSTISESLNLSLKSGELVCLLGPNGVGKSTLIRTLAGLQAPLSGDIKLCGKNLNQISPTKRARKISVVLTENQPFGVMDVFTIVSLGRHPYSGLLGVLSVYDQERVDWALEVVGASTLRNRQITELSDGQRQKIFIARALAQESKFMLLDEPTAFLDLGRRVELMILLRDLAHKNNLALLVSTHELDLALSNADKVWLMTEKGEFRQGSPENLVRSGAFANAFNSTSLDWNSISTAYRKA